MNHSFFCICRTMRGRQSGLIRRRQGISIAICLLVVFGLSEAQVRAVSKLTAVLLIKDALTAPHRPAKVEARLVQRGLISDTGLGGESLQLAVAGKTVASAMTGGDGHAFFEYIPTMRGNISMTVTLTGSPRVNADPVTGLLAVWEHRRPILLVEASTLIRPQLEPLVPTLPLAGRDMAPPDAAPDAADELTRLSQFYYNVMYVAEPRGAPFPITSSSEFRAWLKDHQFPTGLILHQTIGSDGLGTTLDELKQDGWSAIKTGIGRTSAFAAILLERRMEVVLVPEPQQGDVPRKAKTAKDWKEVRKRL